MINKFEEKHAFLSNFAPINLDYCGIRYPSVEHAFQALKSLDDEERRRIAAAPTPGVAKRLGRNLKLRPDWESIKLDVMHQLLRMKFEDTSYALKLLMTYDEPLEEGNTWGDTYWGTVKGKGENHLGKLLMKVRTEVQDAKIATIDPQFSRI